MGMATEQIDKTFANGTPQLPDVQGFDPAQIAAQDSVLAKAGGSLQTGADNVMGTHNFLLSGDVMDVERNPHLRGAIDAAVRPLTENFQNVIMPGLRTEAVSAGPGALNSPKSAARYQTAASNLSRSIGETATTFANDAYKTGLEARTRGLALAPQSMQASLFPEIAAEGVGAQRRELAAAEAAQGFNQTMLPFQLGSQLIANAAGAPGAGSTSTVTGAQPKSNWTQMLGAGLSAASLLAGMPMF